MQTGGNTNSYPIILRYRMCSLLVVYTGNNIRKLYTIYMEFIDDDHIQYPLMT